jgi:hypothetical protein
VLADRTARQRLGVNAVRLASTYPWSRTASSLLDTYASIVPCPGLRVALQKVV